MAPNDCPTISKDTFANKSSPESDGKSAYFKTVFTQQPPSCLWEVCQQVNYTSVLHAAQK